MQTAKEPLKPSSLGAFKELVETIERNKLQDLCQEFRSEEELHNLKRTSSLVAKFQEDALNEKQSRVSAELQVQEKDRLASDAWKIITALKKDKYSLELQVERLKCQKSKEPLASKEDQSARRPIARDVKEPDSENTKRSVAQTMRTNRECKRDEAKAIDGGGAAAMSRALDRKLGNSSSEVGAKSSVVGNESSGGEPWKGSGHTEKAEEPCQTYQNSDNKLPYRRTDGKYLKNSAREHWIERKIEDPSTDTRNRKQYGKSEGPSDLISLWSTKPLKEKAESRNTSASYYSEPSHGNGPSFPATRKHVQRIKESLTAVEPETRENKRLLVHGKSSQDHVIRTREKFESLPSSGLKDAEPQSYQRHNAVDFIRDKERSGNHDTARTLKTREAMKEVEESNAPTAKEEKVGGDMVYTFGRANDELKKPSIRRSLPVEKYGKPKYRSGSKDELTDSTKAALQDILRSHIIDKRQEKQAFEWSKKKPPERASIAGVVNSLGGLPGGIVGKRIRDLSKKLKIGHSTAITREERRLVPTGSGDALCEDLRDPRPGLCGLENLGNSCFMNAGLQCLFVVKPFHRFFLSRGHKKGENVTPKDSHNSLSALLGQLIEKVWSGCYLTCEPSALFKLIHKEFPQLAGYTQHDCQEFLAILLDALHQELNTAPLSAHRRSLTLGDGIHARDADSWWRMFTQKNESIIVDTFQGQFRNKITCLACSHVSVTYQPFSFLSLPLLSQQLQTFIVTLVGFSPEKRNSEKPRALRLRVPVYKPSTSLQLKRSLVELFSAEDRPDLDTLMLGVVRDGALLTFLRDEECIGQFKDMCNKLYAFVPLPPPLSLVAAQINNNRVKESLQLRPNIEPSPTNNTDYSTRFSHESPAKTKAQRKDYIYKEGSDVEGEWWRMDKRANREEGECHHSSKERRKKGRASFGYHLTFTCSLCLEERSSAMLLTHDGCGRMFCRLCLELSMKDDAHDTSCPICARRSSTTRNLKHRFRFHNVPVVFRHCNLLEDDDSIDLFSHPQVVTLPARVTGHDLYGHMSTLLPVSNCTRHEVSSLPFTLHLVNYEGKTCSRCPRSKYCTGCCITGNDIIDLQSTDHIAIQVTNLTRLEIDKMSRFSDHDSMRSRNFVSCKLQLQDCLRSFVDREELEDLWSCPQCKKQRSATKSLAVCRYPDTLIIHLKRYRQTSEKITAPVEYPLEELDMREYMQGSRSPRDPCVPPGESMYDLIGCVCHEGDYDGGHYTAYTRHGINADWCLFDDHNVTKDFPGSSTHRTVYLLFYNRRSDASLNNSIVETEMLDSMKKGKNARQVARPRPLTKSRNIRDGSDIDAGKQVHVSVGSPQRRHSWKEMIETKTHSTSTPLESRDHTENQSQCHYKRKGRGKDPVDRESEMGFADHTGKPAQCDCSQCDYLRGLQQQLKRSRQLEGGGENEHQTSCGTESDNPRMPQRNLPNTSKPLGERRAERAGNYEQTSVQSNSEQSSEHLLVRRASTYEAERVMQQEGTGHITNAENNKKRTKQLNTEYEETGRMHTRRQNKDEADSPPLASSDSLGSDLDSARNTAQQRGPQSPVQRDGYFQPTSSSSGDESVINRQTSFKRSRNVSRTQKVPSTIDAQTQSSATSIESGVQCNMLDHQNLDPTIETLQDLDHRHAKRVDSAVQVSMDDLENSDPIGRAEKVARVTDSEQCIEISVDSETALLTQKLVAAIEKQDIKRTLKLMERGADASLLIDGVSALHIAVSMTSSLGYHFTRLFLNYGTDPNVKSVDGLTPVHVAAMWGKKECLKLLLSRGGDPYEEDDDGLTAIDLAKAFEHETSADTSEYLHKLDGHYSSAINTDSLSDSVAGPELSTSELQFMPYLYGQEAEARGRGRGRGKRIPDFVAETPDNRSLDLTGCGSWTRKARRRVTRNRLLRRLSGSMRRTSSSLMRRLRGMGELLSSSSGSIKRHSSGDMI